MESVEQLLLSGGWQVQTEYSGIADAIVENVGRNWFAVVGLTAGSDCQFEAKTSVVAEIRNASKNNPKGIMVGRPIFSHNLALASEVDAFITALNAAGAALTAQKLFDQSVYNRA